jgi:hypothetical protein
VATSMRLEDYGNAILKGRAGELVEDWQGARDHYRSAVEIRPGWSLAHRALARVCRYLEDARGATAHADLAFKIDFDRSIDQLQQAGLDKRLPMISACKLQHDLEQIDYLVHHGLVSSDLRRHYRGHEDVLRLLEDEPDRSKTYLLNDKTLRTLGEAIYRPLNVHVPSSSEAPLSDGNDFEAHELQYFGQQQVVVVDNLLTPHALEALRRFTLESTVWCDAKPRGYVGAYLDRGLSCELLLRIAFALKAAMPNVFKGHKLEEIWGYRYDSTDAGIGIHADAAAINVNLWITPDSANLTPERGGLVIYPVVPPLDWRFDRYNSRQGREEIVQFVRQSGAAPIHIPYRANRVVIFNSQYFHETDRFVFRDGYADRRTNLTFLYGAARHDPALWLSRGWLSETFPMEETV